MGEEGYGTRNKAEVEMRDSYLLSGHIPFGTLLTSGAKSLIRDPILLVIQYMPGPIGFQLRQWYYRNKLRSFGRGVVIDPDVGLVGMKNISVGNFSYIGRRTQIYCPEGRVKIGKRCHVSAWILGHGGVEIGDYVACGGSILSVTDSHQGGYRMSGPMIPREQRNLQYGKVVIEDDAFIGTNSTIMPGVHIGEGAVVAPGSFVLRDVPAWTVVYGNPAVKLTTRERVKFPKEPG